MNFKVIVATLLLVLSAPVFADCDIPDQQGVSKEAMATIRVACEQALLDGVKAPITSVVGDLRDPEALSAYGIVAQEWAKALGIAAKELGIAVDEFLGTDAGKLTAFIILWQVMGETFLGFLIGVPLLIVIMTVGIRTARKAKIRSVSYSETEKNWRGTPVVTEIVYFDEDQTFMYWAAHIATIILSIMTITWVIFN